MEKLAINNSEYKVKKAKVLRTRRLTDQEKIFQIKLLNNESLNHDPGQFVEVSILGVGEAPISVCSSPTERNSFELVVRNVGRCTSAMHHLEAGDVIGIRGPFGKGFPVQLLQGNDLLFVAGGLGIVPLRSLIHYVLVNRREFGKVTILLGCKSPENMLFGEEIAEWNKPLDINYACTHDQADPQRQANVGLITNLIPGVNLDPVYTYAVIVGPPIMYKFVIKELLAKKIPERQIFLSLERHMKCGLGKCGHCQIESIYCCQDGPVFSYERIKNVRGAI